MVKLILNTLTFLGALWINYYAASGHLTGRTVGDISEKYETLFAPAAYAFSIWGFIYILLILFLAYQWYSYIKEKNKQLINRISVWFVFSNVANGVWIIFWLHEDIGLSVIMMLLLLISLIKIVQRLDLELWDAPLKIIFFVWWPITVYLGWVIIAMVANIATYFVVIGWGGDPFSEELWTIIMIAAATVIYVLLTQKRNMREASLVGIWAFIAIAVRHWETYEAIAYTSLLGTLVLLGTAGYHAYKNRSTSPVAKLGKLKK